MSNRILKAPYNSGKFGSNVTNVRGLIVFRVQGMYQGALKSVADSPNILITDGVLSQQGVISGT